MCRAMRAMWPMSELMGWPPAPTNSAPRETRPASPANVLIEHLGVFQRTSAEVQDLYSRPIPTPVVTLVRRDSLPERQHPEPVAEPDLDAA